MESIRSSSQEIDERRVLEESDEKDRLEKLNLDLKMRVCFLEDKIRKQTMENRYDDGMDNNANLRLLIDEKDLQIEQKNHLLIKAKQIISQLENEVERLRLMENLKENLEDRLHKLKQSNDEMENEYVQQIRGLQQEVASLRQSTSSKEEVLALLENKVDSSQSAYSQLQDRLDEKTAELDRWEEKWMKSQEHLSELEYELTQSRAHADLYRIQYDDLIADLNDEKDKADSKEQNYKKQMESLTAQWEDKLRNALNEKEKDIRSLQENHMKIIEEFKIAAVKLEYEKNNALQRVVTLEDALKSHDDLNNRYLELKEAYSLEKQQLTTLQLQYSEQKTDLLMKSRNLEELRLELQNLYSVDTDLKMTSDICSELKELLSQEQKEKTLLEARLQTTVEALEAAKIAVKEQDSTLDLADSEHKRLVKENGEMKIRLNSFEDILRENERLRGQLSHCQRELDDKKVDCHKYSDIERKLQDELRHTLQQLNDSKEQIRVLEKQSDEFSSHLSHLQAQKDQWISKEETLVTKLQSLQRLNESLEENQKHRESEYQRWESSQEESEVRWKKLLQVCLEAFSRWDRQILTILEGDFFPAVIGSVNPSMSLKSTNNSSTNNNSTNNNSTTTNNNNNNNNFTFGSPSLDQDLGYEDGLRKLGGCLDRFDSRLERLDRLKGLFVMKSEQLASLVLQQVHQCQERVNYSLHVTQDTMGKVEKVKATLTRDRKAREDDHEAMKSFREQMMEDHFVRLHQKEDELQQLSRNFDSINQKFESLSLEKNQLDEDLKIWKHRCSEMESQFTVVGEMEALVDDLSNRMQESSENYRVLSREKEILEDRLQEMQRELREAVAERTSMQSSLEFLSRQVESKEESILKMDKQVIQLEHENQYLRSRQIDPTLLQSIQETQSILRSSSASTSTSTGAMITTTSSSLSDDIHGVKDLSIPSDLNSSKKLEEYVNDFDQLLQQSQSQLREYEKIQVSLPSILREASLYDKEEVVRIVHVWLEDLYRLLEENLRLSQTTHQLGMEWKKYLLRSDPMRSSLRESTGSMDMKSFSSSHATPSFVFPTTPKVDSQISSSRSSSPFIFTDSSSSSSSSSTPSTANAAAATSTASSFAIPISIPPSHRGRHPSLSTSSSTSTSSFSNTNTSTNININTNTNTLGSTASFSSPRDSSSQLLSTPSQIKDMVANASLPTSITPSSSTSLTRSTPLLFESTASTTSRTPYEMPLSGLGNGTSVSSSSNGTHLAAATSSLSHSQHSFHSHRPNHHHHHHHLHHNAFDTNVHNNVPSVSDGWESSRMLRTPSSMTTTSVPTTTQSQNRLSMSQLQNTSSNDIPSTIQTREGISSLLTTVSNRTPYVPSPSNSMTMSLPLTTHALLGTPSITTTSANSMSMTSLSNSSSDFRSSMQRLSRLGGNLHDLARKLDSLSPPSFVRKSSHLNG